MEGTKWFRKKQPTEIDGPTKNANSNVPIPTVPPRNQPEMTTNISIVLRTIEKGKLVTLVSPVISPSLAPGPRLALRYRAAPKPTIRTPINDCNI